MNGFEVGRGGWRGGAVGELSLISTHSRVLQPASIRDEERVAAAGSGVSASKRGAVIGGFGKARDPLVGGD